MREKIKKQFEPIKVIEGIITVHKVDVFFALKNFDEESKADARLYGRTAAAYALHVNRYKVWQISESTGEMEIDGKKVPVFRLGFQYNEGEQKRNHAFAPGSWIDWEGE